MVRSLLFIVISTITAFVSSYAQSFDNYFEDKTLRIDYIHAGDSRAEHYYFEALKEEPHFGGSHRSLVDDNNFGVQLLKLYDVATGELIYSRGFCTLFNEWQTTPEASVVSRGYRESMVMPFPKREARIEIHSRNRDGEFVKCFEHIVDPQSPYIERREPSLESFDLHIGGEVATSVDVVLLAEGYSAEEYDKFRADCQNLSGQIFDFSPLKESAAKFNVRGVWSSSLESGVSNPGDSTWCNTALGAKFYTFESERYQMVDDLQRVRDVAANVPYDLIYIITNSDKYGGGGIYNFYGISSASRPDDAGRIFVHEFGHLLLGLADEYDYGDASADEFYPDGVEPWEINITRSLDLEEKPIWRALIDPSTPTPTEATEENSTVVGLYEGGGYIAKGIYRPWVNCMMRSLDDSQFCPVCQEGISQMIDFICR